MSIFNQIFDKYDYKEVCGLTDELKCLYLSNKFHNENNSLLFVANTLFEASKLYQMLLNYTSDVLFFPMDDFLTSEVLAVSLDFQNIRLNTLNELINDKKKIVVTNLMGFLRFLPLKDIFIDSYVTLETNKEYEQKKLIEKLMSIGYQKETIVNKTGEIANRGYIIDIFPLNSENPVRIEFWGDQIESIRYFNVNSQLTIKKIDKVSIMPNTEFLTKENTIPTKQRELINYGSVGNIFDYLSSGILIANNFEEIETGNNNLLEEIKNYSESNSISDTKFMNNFNDYKLNINLCTYDNNGINLSSNTVNISYKKQEELKEILSGYLKKQKKVVICAENRYQANKIIQELDGAVFTNESEIFKDKINIIIKSINEGYIIDNLVVISEKDIFGKKSNYQPYKTNFKYGTRIKDITKINIGDYVVHSIHGIGKYLGLKTISKNGLMKDYLNIQYSGGDHLYIPVEKIEFISKYNTSEGFAPKLSKLGGTEWAKTKIRAREKAKDMADELLKLYAVREASTGFSFAEDDKNQIEFEKEFSFLETPDQLKVIAEIKKDMEEPHPMDRLLCGDVGYGKTEVAFRIAFKAILSGKQVAILCPTTILSNQHYQNAIDRFKSFPVTIKLLNRFISKKETNQIIKDLEEGKVDFVIGTHKLLNDQIRFKDLGLLIIDEEQRFGVTHKEKIKQYKKNIDVLTLSATPIPRTLQMSLSGVRSLSLIETPPSNRYPIQTYVLGKDKNVIKEAIYKELSRNGQVFILYNHIDDIEDQAKEISLLVKEAKITVAHGRMEKRKLEDVMMKFINKEYDVLLCTTIIETGIDIPNVNTLIVIDADRFGLSQLYQIRGRVGRTNKIAYCYLMYDSNKILSDLANKRLKAIKEFTELGSGFQVAMRDLSIRGAGDILGSSQAGFVDSVGIEMFTKMLSEEIERLKGNIIESETIKDNQPLLDIETSINDEYVNDTELKIEIHKKINEIDSYDKLVEIKKELEDRFGKLSENLTIYMYGQWFENLANKLKITKIKQNKNNIELMIDKEDTNKLDGEKLFMETLSLSTAFKFGMQRGNLIITLNITKLKKHFVYYLIDLLKIIEKMV